MDPLRLLIADDHPMFRFGLRALLESAGFEVVAEVERGEDAWARAVDLQPDVVLMDIQMPGMSGLEATRRVRLHSPCVRVLMLTMFEDDESVFSAIRAGASGYLLKGARQEEVVRAITGVANGEAIFGASVAQRVMEYFSTLPSRKADLTDAFPDLTLREREVLELIAQRLTNAEIARRLELRPKTVRNYVSNVLSKLQVADRAEAMLAARAAAQRDNTR